MTQGRKSALRKAQTAALLAAIQGAAIQEGAIRVAGTPAAVILAEALGADLARGAEVRSNLPDATLKTTPECNR
jgi:hypothetical protein